MTGFLVLILGNVLAAFGISLCAVADKGVDPLTVVYQGSSNVLNVDIGVGVIVVNLVLLIICLLIDKKSIKLGTIFTLLTFSSMLSAFINLLMPIMRTENGLILWIYLILGTVLMGVGFSITMYAKVGPSVLDVLLELILVKYHLSVKVCKTILDVCSLVIGYLLGGSVGVGTVLAILCVGSVYEVTLKVLDKYFGSHKD